MKPNSGKLELKVVSYLIGLQPVNSRENVYLSTRYVSTPVGYNSYYSYYDFRWVGVSNILMPTLIPYISASTYYVIDLDRDGNIITNESFVIYDNKGVVTNAQTENNKFTITTIRTRGLATLIEKTYYLHGPYYFYVWCIHCYYGCCGRTIGTLTPTGFDRLLQTIGMYAVVGDLTIIHGDAYFLSANNITITTFEGLNWGVSNIELKETTS
jgi:hypothetical protein